MDLKLCQHSAYYTQLPLLDDYLIYRQSHASGGRAGPFFVQEESQNWTKDSICMLAGNSWDHWCEGLTPTTSSSNSQTNQNSLVRIALASQ